MTSCVIVNMADKHLTPGVTIAITSTIFIMLYILQFTDGQQSCIDLTKKTIDQSMVDAVIKLQPKELILNKAITSTKALKTLLSGLQHCTVCI